MQLWKGLHELRNIFEKLQLCISFSMSSVAALWSSLKLSEAISLYPCWIWMKSFWLKSLLALYPLSEASEALWSSLSFLKLSEQIGVPKMHLRYNGVLLFLHASKPWIDVLWSSLTLRNSLRGFWGSLDFSGSLIVSQPLWGSVRVASAGSG